MRTPSALAILLLLLPVACGGDEPIPKEDLLLAITAETAEAEFGKAFPLTVVRVHAKDLAIDPFDEGSLAPLTIEVLETIRRENDRRVEERIRCAARVFLAGDVLVRGPVLRARPLGGGPERSVAALPLRFRVRSSLPEGAAGPAELPGPPRRDDPPVWLFPGLGVVALLGVLFFLRRGRRTQRGPVAEAGDETAPAAPHEVALARLERLARSEPKSRDEIDEFHGVAVEIVREFMAEHFACRTRRMTSEELLLIEMEEPPRSRLAEFLAGTDRVRFARHRPSGEEREITLTKAADFVRGSAAP